MLSYIYNDICILIIGEVQIRYGCEKIRKIPHAAGIGKGAALANGLAVPFLLKYFRIRKGYTAVFTREPKIGKKKKS